MRSSTASQIKDTETYTPAYNVGITNIDENVAMYDVVGTTMWIDGYCTFDGSGGAGAAFTVDLPPGWEIDTTKQAEGTAIANNKTAEYGTGTWFETGAAWRDYKAVFKTTTTIGFHNNTGILVDSTFVNLNGMNYHLKVKVKPV